MNPDLVVQLSQIARENLTAARSELERARRIVADAVASLTKSFYKLVEDSTAQRELVRGLLGGGSGGVMGIDGFIDETGGTLRTVTEALRRISADIQAGNRQTDPMLEQVETVTRVLLQLDSISRQSRILSINARIEAGRVGASGAAFVVVAGAMRDLAQYCGGLSETIGGQVSLTHQLLERVRGALARATEQGLVQAAGAEQRSVELIERLQGLRVSLEQELGRLDLIVERVKDNVDAAVRGLQFSDMVDQLLVSVDQRMGRVQQAVAASEEAVQARAPVADLQSRVAELRAQSAVACAVQQTSVTEGSVQLF